MSEARDLAERFHGDWLEAHPLAATSYGIPGYDHLMPDDSESGDARRREALVAYLRDVDSLGEAPLDAAEGVTVGCLRSQAEQELAALDSAALEYTVTPMPFIGPAALMASAARTVLTEAEDAKNYLIRLQSAGVWIDQVTQRLRIGHAKGRLPVAPLVDLTIKWAEDLLAQPVPAPLSAPQPPQGWSGAADWAERRDRIAEETVKPALARWTELLRQLRGSARPMEQAGLAHLPGGPADYARAILTHTTLPLSAEELHHTGLEEITRLEAAALEIAGSLGLTGLSQLHEAARAASLELRPEEAIERAVTAIRRAEAQAADIFPQPLPPPCEVMPMPSVVAASGMAPHYTPPRLDGSRPGTYWFNTERPTAGTGWDLEAVAFHEAVPGHHLQLSRVQLLSALPALQRQRSTTVFSEGWGLYAEQLAEEVGLYSGPQSLIGAISASLMRAARLVLDTGIHAMGWSRKEALAFYVAHVPMPEEFLATEIDRYIIIPGQALAYLTGKLELLRLRDLARQRLGAGFDLPSFHAAVLDSGSLPLPVLRSHIDAWSTAGI